MFVLLTHRGGISFGSKVGVGEEVIGYNLREVRRLRSGNRVGDVVNGITCLLDSGLNNIENNIIYEKDSRNRTTYVVYWKYDILGWVIDVNITKHE
jgi:hypothetical protein